METWEFFLQQVGETTWLRLDATPPELPTGRYTVAARAPHRSRELMEVEVSTRESADTIARKRQRQYSCQLDEQGWGILLSETELSPGIWEIQCRADLLSALLGNDWGITLSLRVTLDLAKASLPFQQRREPQSSMAEDSREQADLDTLRSRLLADADEMAQEVMAEIFPSCDPYEFDDSNSASPAYSLHLDREQILSDLDKPIIISGQAIARQDPPHPQLRLFIALWNPQTGDTIAQLSPRLPSPPFPLTFCYSLTAGPHCDSYLLEGEVALGDDKGPEHAQIFDRRRLTVSAQWEQLQPLLTAADRTTSHPPAPLSPLSLDNPWAGDLSSPTRRGALPPRLAAKGKDKERKKKMPPKLPKLPNSSPPPPQEYVWSKPETEPSSYPQWELIPELVIISTDETSS